MNINTGKSTSETSLY